MSSFLRKHFEEVIKPELKKLRGYKNVHEIPKIVKVVINSGVDAAAEKNVVTDLAKDIGLITGQKAIITKARTSVANFKLRENQPIGVKVTLRGESMYEFLYRLIAVAAPERFARRASYFSASISFATCSGASRSWMPPC
jgi:large subunit ribosomal protein L5